MLTQRAYSRRRCEPSRFWAKLHGRDTLASRGEARGEAKNARSNLRLLLTAKYGANSDLFERRIDAAPLEQLDTWMLRLIHAPTLTEVFTD